MQLLADSLLRPGLHIDGVLQDRAGGGSVPHVNAATGKPQAEVMLAGPSDVDTAVASARAAFESWRAWSPSDRRTVLQRIATLLMERGENLATATTLEIGTPIRFTRARNPGVAAWFEYYAGWCDKLTGDTYSMPVGQFDMTVLEPVGVVGKIITWNTPLSGLGMGVAPALAAGCCVVIKPSELAPFVCLRFAELCIEAGLPPGVVNVIPGTADAGRRLVEHPGIAKISFTGGPTAARSIQAAAASSLTPAVFELGGKSANIVFEDADIARAVANASTFTALTGQGCSLPTRLLVQSAVHDDVVAQLVARVEGLVAGDPLDAATEFGPLISEDACDRVAGSVAAALADGSASLASGGTRFDGELSQGFFLHPTVLTDVAPNAPIAQNEMFGPVVVVHRFDDEDEAISVANSTRFGLAAYLHTRDVNRVLRLVRRLEAGNIGVNGSGVPQAPAGPFAPFGGVKDSGYGREGGREGILEFMRVKNVLIGEY